MKDTTALASLGKIVQGLSYTRYTQKDRTRYPILQVTNLVGETVRLLEGDRIESLDEQKVQEFVARPGQLLLALRGSTFKAAIVPDDFPPAIIGNNLTVFTVNEKALPAFVLLLLNSEPMRKLIADTATGTALPQIPLARFKELSVRVPSRDEQQALVGVARALQEQRAAFEVLQALRELKLSHQAQAFIPTNGA